MATGCALLILFKESEVIKMPAKILVSTEDMPYADWLEYRKQGIGGSDASVVCGINRYKSPVELWMEKTAPTPGGRGSCLLGDAVGAVCSG